MAPPEVDPLRGPPGLTAPDLPGVIRATGLLPPGAAVLVAVSGGPDSLALLHALVRLRDAGETGDLRFVVPCFSARGPNAAPNPSQDAADEAGSGSGGTRAEARDYEPEGASSSPALCLVVAHLDHGLRDDSPADAARVADLARAWGLPFAARAVDVRALAAEEGRTLEEAGREARYRFFAEAAAEHRCTHVALGHTADDQAETVLLNLLRGTGLTGLAGMPPERPLGPWPLSPRLLRPLLGVRREESLAYCRAHGLEPVLDPSNESPEFTRNRIRHGLLPLLAAEYNPRIVARLAQMASTVRGELELRDALAEELIAEASLPGPSDWVRLDLQRLCARPRALIVAALRLAFRGVAGDWTQLDQAATQRLLALLDWGPPRRVSLVDGWSAGKTGFCLWIARGEPWVEQQIEPRPLPVPGAIELRDAGYSLEAALLPPPVPLPAPRFIAYLDVDQVRGGLRVRSAKAGDRIRPLGMHGTKKVSDLLNQRRVPRPDRGLVPLVVDDEKIVWVAGHAIHQDARITEATRRVLVLRLKPLA